MEIHQVSPGARSEVGCLSGQPVIIVCYNTLICDILINCDNEFRPYFAAKIGKIGKNPQIRI
jgi:hypothetical protein